MTYNLKRLREKPNKITTFFERKKAKTVFSLQENFFYKSRQKKIGKGYLLALNSSVFKLSIHKLEHCWLALYYVQKRGVANDPVLGCFGYQIGQKITLYNTRIKRSLI